MYASLINGIYSWQLFPLGFMIDQNAGTGAWAHGAQEAAFNTLGDSYALSSVRTRVLFAFFPLPQGISASALLIFWMDSSLFWGVLCTVGSLAASLTSSH